MSVEKQNMFGRLIFSSTLPYLYCIVFLLTAERCQVFPDLREERHRRLEFNTSAVNILNSLEYLGYRVITSGSFVASQANNKKVKFVVFVVDADLLTVFYFREASTDSSKESLSGLFTASPMIFKGCVVVLTNGSAREGSQHSARVLGAGGPPGGQAGGGQ